MEFFQSDEPIKTRAYDVLKRTKLAQTLATWITSQKKTRNIVVSIQGKWGSGKSSLKNLCIQQLKNHRNVSIIDFNSWSYSSHEQLIEAFFDELINIPDTKFLKAKPQIEAYSALLRAGKPTQQSINKSAVDRSSITGGTNHPSNKSFRQIRQALESKLAQLKKPVVIFLDDIDRLLAKEIRMLFRFVTASANLPNIIFVLCFQRKTVVKALSFNNNDGRLFLEKLIQLPIDLPVMEGELFDRVVKSRLEKNCLTGHLNKANQYEWEILFKILQSVLDNLRQSTRFSNSVTFHASLMQTAGVLEVNMFDLIALEALKMFEPSLYANIYPNQKTVFFNAAIIYDLGKRLSQEHRAEVLAPLEKLISRAKNKKFAKDCLAFLFPYLHNHFLNDEKDFGRKRRILKEDETDDQALNTFRIAHELNFSRYFMLSVATKDITSKQFTEIWSLIDDAEKLFKILKSYEKKEAIDVVLERLHSARKDVLAAHRIPYCAGLMKFAAQTDQQSKIAQMVVSVLMEVKNSEQRARLLIESIKLSHTSVLLPNLLKHVVLERHEKKRILNGKASDYFIRFALKQIKDEKSVEIWKHKDSFMLPYWWAQIDLKSARSFVATKSADANWLASIIVQLVEQCAPQLISPMAQDWVDDFNHIGTDTSFVKTWLEALFQSEIEAVAAKLHQPLQGRDPLIIERLIKALRAYRAST